MYSNTAIGYSALWNTNATGEYDTAVGSSALAASVTGSDKTALGVGALQSATAGNWNIGLGMWAGESLSNGNYNTDIGNPGMASDDGTTRIGVPAQQTRAFIAGIRGVTTGNADAYYLLIDSNGQLGTVNSSRTAKRDIRDMGDTTDTIMGLRPVRFRYIAHGPDSPEQFGLIAEEVAEVAPELVGHGSDGKIETVYYDKVNAMLLNEVQKHHRLMESQKEELRVAERRNPPTGIASSRARQASLSRAAERNAKRRMPARAVAEALKHRVGGSSVGRRSIGEPAAIFLQQLETPIRGTPVHDDIFQARIVLAEHAFQGFRQVVRHVVRRGHNTDQRRFRRLRIWS